MDVTIGLGLCIAILFLAYLYLYISSRQYLRQGFTDGTTRPWWDLSRFFWLYKSEDASGNLSPGHQDISGSATDGYVTVDKEVTRPYTEAKIMGLDDYEHNLVFQNEADREISTDMRRKLMSQYPMDWSTQPPSSSQFQQGMREMFQDGGAEQQEGATNPYTAITEDSLTPPDTLSLEQEERSIIQSYQPKHAGDLTTYNVEDAMELIKKIYDKKGEIPQVVQKGNVYEIIGTRKKDEKIVYEETEGEAPASTDPVPAAGENTTVVPQAAADKNTALDPFYEPDGNDNTRKGRWSYRQWTPGLERMFAPTEARTNWY